MVLHEMLRELIAERKTDPQAAAWQDAAQLLLLLASDEADDLPPLVVELALRGAAASLADADSLQKLLSETAEQLIRQGRDDIRCGGLLQELAQTLRSAPQGR